MNTTKLTNQIDKEIQGVNSKLNGAKGLVNTLEAELKKLLDLRGALAPFNSEPKVSAPIDANSSLAPEQPTKKNVSLEDLYAKLPDTFTTANLQAIAERDFEVTNPNYKYGAIHTLKHKGWIETVSGQFQTYKKVRDAKI